MNGKINNLICLFNMKYNVDRYANSMKKYYFGRRMTPGLVGHIINNIMVLKEPKIPLK